MMRFRFRGAAAVPKAFPVMIRTVKNAFPVPIPGAPIVAVLGVGLAVFCSAYCAFCLFGAGRRAAGVRGFIFSFQTPRAGMIMRISTVSPPGLPVMAQGAAVFLSAHFANGCPGTGVAAVMVFPDIAI